MLVEIRRWRMFVMNWPKTSKNTNIHAALQQNGITTNKLKKTKFPKRFTTFHNVFGFFVFFDIYDSFMKNGCHPLFSIWLVYLVLSGPIQVALHCNTKWLGGTQQCFCSPTGRLQGATIIPQTGSSQNIYFYLLLEIDEERHFKSTVVCLTKEHNICYSVLTPALLQLCMHITHKSFLILIGNLFIFFDRILVWTHDTRRSGQQERTATSCHHFL